MTDQAQTNRDEWCQAYVHAWAQLSAGQYDPHAAWDEAQEAYESRAVFDPTLIASNNWAIATRRTLEPDADWCNAYASRLAEIAGESASDAQVKKRALLAHAGGFEDDPVTLALMDCKLVLLDGRPLPDQAGRGEWRTKYMDKMLELSGGQYEHDSLFDEAGAMHITEHARDPAEVAIDEWHRARARRT